ncbi:glyoxalase superfamily protein [Deinococcus soli (ex Cha et al. 2016)]|uniref:Uncharacterized protein n=2 Tax=Deinococcus soli (ex Cha et al. 2016) TaxID=1309411 RepID=A0ACC6KHB7_9DEIO|nr:glyoxalase superfamily protein [Deinococcus soli (ex Cha et al. 2016)]MDR6218845.1 hypothetical protein [Deinococcus soli (ex Cha et al. 2016)]MDR6328642.1 hypothetical protein [Deinococcus soli (ex Cha et al. 2016)]MDR6751871.1 hypothetical protein [Deinococcus soli (ex Cha et al. 2016)]
MQNNDLKAQARRLRTALKRQGVTIGHNDAQHLTAQAHGFANWQTVRAAQTPPVPTAPGAHTWFTVTFASTGRRGVHVDAPRPYPTRDAALDAAAAALIANVYSEAGFDLDAFDEAHADESALREYRALETLEQQALTDLDAARNARGPVTVSVPLTSGEPFTVTVHELTLPTEPPRALTLREPGFEALTVNLRTDDPGALTLTPLSPHGEPQGRLRLTYRGGRLSADVFTRQDDEHDREPSAHVTLHAAGPLRVFETSLDGQPRRTWTVSSAAELLEQLNDHDSIWDVPVDVAHAAWDTGRGAYTYQDGRTFQVTERVPDSGPVALAVRLDLTPGTVDPDPSDVATTLCCLPGRPFDAAHLEVFTSLADLHAAHGLSALSGAPAPAGRRRHFLYAQSTLGCSAFLNAFMVMLRDSNTEDPESYTWELDTLLAGTVPGTPR